MSVVSGTLTLSVEEYLARETEAEMKSEYDHYKTIPSFREYLLNAQDKPRVQQFTRLANGH